MVVTVSHFHPRLIFVGTAGTFLSVLVEPFMWFLSEGMILALLENITLLCKYLPGAHSHYDIALKVLFVQAQGVWGLRLAWKKNFLDTNTWSHFAAAAEMHKRQIIIDTWSSVWMALRPASPWRRRATHPGWPF